YEFECDSYDFVVVFDGDGNEDGRRYCGSETEIESDPPPLEPIVVEGNIAVITFQSDGSNTLEGFRAEFQKKIHRSAPNLKSAADLMARLRSSPDQKENSRCDFVVCPPDCKTFMFKNPRTDCFIC
ncbi:hypothetical protein BaRGS_00037368, partial [Batillaria attramentaria]